LRLLHSRAMAVTAWAAIGIGFAGLYSVISAGTTGGPNHGDHPFLVTVIHMGCFAWFATGWPVLSRELYWGGLAAALVLSIVALRKTHDVRRGWLIPLRLGLAAVYAGLMFVLFRKP
jgi:hypothetical protein